MESPNERFRITSEYFDSQKKATTDLIRYMDFISDLVRSQNGMLLSVIG